MDINPYSNQCSTVKNAIGTILPAAHLRYTGTATTYAIFMFYNSLPEVLASGRNHRTGVYGDVDLFSTTDLDSGLASQVVTALINAGITVKDCRDADFETATKTYHKMIEIYIPVKR